MPLYTDMIMDNFEDYANHHEDDGVIKLQNMPEDASMEQWGAKLQNHDEFIYSGIFSDVLAGILLSG